MTPYYIICIKLIDTIYMLFGPGGVVQVPWVPIKLKKPQRYAQDMIFKPPHLVHIPISSNQSIWFKFSQVYSF